MSAPAATTATNHKKRKPVILAANVAEAARPKNRVFGPGGWRLAALLSDPDRLAFGDVADEPP